MSSAHFGLHSDVRIATRKKIISFELMIELLRAAL